MILTVWERLGIDEIHAAVLDAYFKRCEIRVEGKKVYKVYTTRINRKELV